MDSSFLASPPRPPPPASGHQDTTFTWSPEASDRLAAKPDCCTDLIAAPVLASCCFHPERKPHERDLDFISCSLRLPTGRGDNNVPYPLTCSEVRPLRLRWTSCYIMTLKTVFDVLCLPCFLDRPGCSRANLAWLISVHVYVSLPLSRSLSLPAAEKP